MGQSVLDSDALTQAMPGLVGRDEFAEAMLQLFVLGDADRPAGIGRGHRAARAQPASTAGLGIEFDDTPGLGVLDLAGRALN